MHILPSVEPCLWRAGMLQKAVAVILLCTARRAALVGSAVPEFLPRC